MDATENGRKRRALRVAAGMTLRGLAARAGVSPTSIVKAESGEPVMESVLRSVAGALGLPVGEYLEPSVPVGARDEP